MATSLTLKSRKEILTALKKARSIINTGELEIRIAPGEELPGRLLVVIPKKVGSAPTRNLIRRRLKAIFFEEKLFNIPYHWIFFVRKGLDKWEFERLRALVVESAAKFSVFSS